MGEWWTYSLGDFLLFAPRTYYRLFELYNAAIWPLQIATLALGAAILGLVRWGGAWRGRASAAILALLWLWVGWAYHLERYQTINWAAEYFAWGFALEALLLAGVGVAGNALASARATPTAGRAGLAIFVFALAPHPLAAPLLGRPWAQAEVFGIAPDPTVLGTLGLLLLATRRARWLLLPLPLAWCAISGATAWAMKAPDAPLMPAAGLLALAAATFGVRSDARAVPRAR